MIDNTGKTKLEVDRSPSLVSDAFIFAKSDDWVFQRDEQNPRDSRIEGPPGTWARLPREWRSISKHIQDIICITRCPNCKNFNALHMGVHRFDHLGRVSPDYKCMNCDFHRIVYLDEINDKPLYACAIERLKGGKWKPEMIYTHAQDQTEALKQLGKDAIDNRVRIVGIGRAIGFKVMDNHGERLLA